MKYIFTLLLFVFVTINLSANSKIDSLYNALSGADSNIAKITALHSIGKYYLKKTPDSAMVYALAMHKLSVKENDSLNIGYSYKLKGDAGIYGGNLKASERNYLQAIAVFNSISEFDLVSDAKNNLGIVYQFSGQYNKAILLYKESLQKSIDLSDTLSISKSYNNIGSLYVKMGNTDEALVYLQKSLAYKKLLNDSVGIAKTLQNIGNIFMQTSNNTEAIKYYKKAMRIKFSIGDSLSVSTTISNIGLSYKNMSNYDKAIKYYFQALDIAKLTGYQKQEALIYNNIASTYDEWSTLDSTNVYYKERIIDYYTKSVKISEEINDNESIINALNNLGTYYTQENEYDKAMVYFLKCLKYANKYGYKNKEIFIYVNIADIYLKREEFSDAISFLNKSLKLLQDNPSDIAYIHTYDKFAEIYYFKNNFILAKNYALKVEKLANKVGDASLKKTNNKRLSVIYAGVGDYEKAYRSYLKYSHLKDSIFNKDTKNTIIQLQTLHKTKEQKQEIKILNTTNKLNVTELKAEKLKLRQQRILSIGLFLIIVLVLVFLYLLYLQIKAKNRANRMLFDKNEEINTQKDEIELQLKLIKKQNTEITDSINYARLIQDAILPSIDILKPFFTDYFVLFEPKSIVSGDFYWIAKYKNKVIVAAVDCTGHGVPGAFMSMLGVSFLNEIALNNSDLNSAEILNLLREKVITSLQQSNSDSNQKDGMDMSLSIIDTENKIIDFAGAYNPLIIVTSINSNIAKAVEVGRNKLEYNNLALVELKADRMPISISRKTNSFNSSVIKYQEKDKIFMFSDGFVDQFHYKTLKKYKKNKFKELIIESSNYSISKQGEILKRSFENWKKDTEQTDDILVVGIDL